MDEFIIQPALHSAVGGITLLTALVTTVLTWVAFRKNTMTKTTYAALIALQVVLMLQAAIGIKLLDQGMGVIQKYVHYLGGLGSVGLLMLFFWLPRRSEASQARNAAWLTTASLVFIAMTFFIGQVFVKSQLNG
ncbi:hypothetical protein D3875_17450 [Deinococcus cavernae]|uniref:Cytochrome b561 domain-containing protein n=1 Tax=Deinococcus cavernae TaxID=2320857 RepID=A0A418VAK6_9DEIO|nr:hypothetical protein [Deinococcus cavernae]RJF73062.1 hypothetical protein D3875_17450 [Deinococcus cavernae]